MGRLRAIAVLFAILFMGAGALGGVLAVVGREPGRGDVVVIGSKAFTEGIILGEILAQTIEQSGLRVERRFNLGGTNICFEALRSGSIDLYAEYTGTGLMAILEHPPMSDPAAVLQTVRDQFAARYDLVWLDPFGFNNTYALAMSQQLANRLEVRRISDLTRHPGLRAGFASEFLARADGWPGLQEKYGLRFGDGPVAMEAGLMYQAAAAGQVDVISAYSTDGRIATLNLTVLEDDRRFFPPYEAVTLARRDTLAKHSGLDETLAALGGRISEADIRTMNAEVDAGTKSAAEVAAEFLRKKKGLPSARTP